MKSVKRYRPAGFLLPTATIYIVVAMILGVGILMLGAGEQSGAIRRTHREQAFYIAETGLSLGRARFEEDPDWLPASGEIEFPPGGRGGYTLRFEPEPPGEPARLVSTGTVRNARGNVLAEVELAWTLSMQEGEGVWRSVFARGIYSRGQITMSGTSRIEGDANSDRGIHLGSGSVEITGDATVSTGNEEDISGSIEKVGGDLRWDGAEREMPNVEIPQELLELDYAAHGDPGLSGDYYLVDGNYRVERRDQAVISAGDYRFASFDLTPGQAELTFRGKVRLYIEQIVGQFRNATIIVEADEYGEKGVTMYLGPDADTLHITGGTEMNVTPDGEPNDPADFLIYSVAEGDVDYEVDPDADDDWEFFHAQVNAVLYAPKVTSIRMRGNSNWWGGIVINGTLDMSGSSTIIEDVSLRDNEQLPVYLDTDYEELLFERWEKPGWQRLRGP